MFWGVEFPFNNIYPFIRVLINNVQHGFVRNRSCVTQLLGVLNDTGKSLDSNKQVHVLHLDISKAFDSVDHAILLQKFQWHGINGSFLRWLESYLNDRQQRVVFSSWSPVSSGVPQGSIHGPLLFVIFMKDLSDNLSSITNSALYEDDSKSYSEIRSADNCQSLQEDLTMLENRCTKSRMNFNHDFNTGKFKALTVTRKRKPINF